MLTKQEIKNHYSTPEVQQTIIRVATDGEYSRAGMKLIPNAFKDKKTGELVDLMDWYNLRSYTPEEGKRKEDKKINLSLKEHYNDAVSVCRTLYWTLNFFDADIYTIDFHNFSQSDRTYESREHTVGYMLGVDIDKDHGCDIHDPAVKKAVEDMAQYFSDRLRAYAPNSVYCLYSGGGIYVVVHHKVFEPYFEKFKNSADWHEMLHVLLDAFNLLISDFREDFFRLHPEHIGKVKPDQLNGSQRVFKSIYSIHAKMDYAVIPLDPTSIKIDFDRATLPLKPAVLADGENWYTKYDDGTTFLNLLLKPLLWRAKETRDAQGKFTGTPQTSVSTSALPVDFSNWPPCMKNLYNLEKCGEGATRALAIFVSFLGQAGVPEDTAQDMFYTLVNRWNARPSNIFTSYYKKMNVPTCLRLNSNDTRAFPHGISIKNLHVCKMDSRCVCITSPYMYVDVEANKKRIEKANKYHMAQKFIKTQQS